MRLLLDSHLLLRWLGKSAMVSETARRLIGDPGNLVFVSVVSHWELWLKSSLGKLNLPPGFAERLAAQPFESLPLTPSQIRVIADLPWHHKDPFDRMLVAQAKHEGFTLLTSDGRLTQYGDWVQLV